MAVANLPYTYSVRRGAKVYWRFRRGKLDVSLPGCPADAQFHVRYGALMGEHGLPAPRHAPGTVAELVAAYEVSVEFKALRPSTQIDYTRTLKLVVTEIGVEQYRLVRRGIIKIVRDDLAGTPRKAHKFVQMVSRLYSWADECGLVSPGSPNPTDKLKRLKVRVEHYTPWSEEEIARFLAHAPLHVRTPVLLAICTGQRAADVVAMTWTDYQRGHGGAIIRVRQSKTGEALDIACPADLIAHLDALPSTFGGPIARSARGRPYTPGGFAQTIRRELAKIQGMPLDRGPHGLRYACAGRQEDAGVPAEHTMAVLGQRTFAMAMQYRRQRRLAREAMERVEQTVKVRT